MVHVKNVGIASDIVDVNGISNLEISSTYLHETFLKLYSDIERYNPDQRTRSVWRILKVGKSVEGKLIVRSDHRYI